ncbi:MAG: hypothetical protein HOP21_12415 [Methylotenera sp.]|nr:hypothetical protein [Methylotenera sp.]
MHIRVTHFFLVLSISVLTACAGPKVLDVSSAEGPTARLRVLTTGSNVYLHPNKSCYTLYSKSAITGHTGGRNYGLFDSATILASNKKVGMPLTEDITWAFHEFNVRANQPMTIFTSYVSVGEVAGQWRSSSCGPIAGILNPEPDKDYDAALIFEEGRCYLRVRELVSEHGKVNPVELNIQPTSECNI